LEWSGQIIGAFIGAVVLLILNLLTFILTYGRLSQKVEDLNHTVNNGLCEKVQQTCADVAQMKGNLETYMKLEHEIKKMLVRRIEVLESKTDGS